MYPRVSVNIVSWNGMKFIPELLASIFAQTYTDFNVLIVDNGSSDGVEAYVREHFPQVAFLRNARNLGFAPAHNQAIRYAIEHWGGEDLSDRFVLVTNQDAIFAPTFLEEIVRAAVERAIHVYVTDDPLKMHLVFPELKELEAMQFEGGCSACAFTGLATSISGLIDGRKPEVRADVATVGGRVNVRAFLPDGVLAIVVGYLDHENVFENVFHEDLVARLQPLLTPELIREVIQNHLVMGEVARRAHTRAHSTMWEAYGLDIYEIATLADAKEAEIEEDMRRERERPPMRSRFEAFLRESLMMDDTDPG